MRCAWMIATLALGAHPAASAEPTHRMFVTNEKSNSVSVIDAATLAVIKMNDTGKRARDLAMNRDKTRLYVTNGASNTLTVIDTATNEAMANVEVGEAPWGVVVDG